ncbi:hypothetical protein JCM19233_4848 [Vibrio astriarenae]|nr:hypothetical protein JCM19233_4848 [Vibrio sp. C7]
MRSLQYHPSSTIAELSQRLNINSKRVETFIHFGLANGLIIRGL